MKASAITLELLTPQIESFKAMHAIKDWNAMAHAAVFLRKSQT